MTKRKDSAALFEVVRKVGDNAPGAAGPLRPSGATAPRGRALKQPPGLAPAARVPAARPGTDEPPVAISDGRLRLNLSYLSGGAIVAGVLVLLVAAYSLGQASRSHTDESAAAGVGSRDGIIAGGVVRSGGEAPGRNDATPPAGFDPVRVQEQALAGLLVGRPYLVVESFGIKTDADAVEIQKYLWENGRLTARIQLGRNLAILDTRDLNGVPDDQRLAYAKTFEAIGKRWQGAWKFLQADEPGKLYICTWQPSRANQ